MFYALISTNALGISVMKEKNYHKVLSNLFNLNWMQIISVQNKLLSTCRETTLDEKWMAYLFHASWFSILHPAANFLAADSIRGKLILTTARVKKIYERNAPRLRFRQKWHLIRPSQTKATSDQTDRDWSVLWLDYRALEAPCALKVRSKTSSVQTTVSSKIIPWSDWSALEKASDQTEVRSKLPIIRLKCARNHL